MTAGAKGEGRSEEGEVVDGLTPAESLSLAVAKAQVLRGDEPTPNVAAVCILALVRLGHLHDWDLAWREQAAIDIRTLMAKLLGPVYPSDTDAEAAWRRLYDALPPVESSGGPEGGPDAR